MLQRLITCLESFLQQRSAAMKDNIAMLLQLQCIGVDLTGILGGRMAGLTIKVLL